LRWYVVVAFSVVSAPTPRREIGFRKELKRPLPRRGGALARPGRALRYSQTCQGTPNLACWGAHGQNSSEIAPDSFFARSLRVRSPHQGQAQTKPGGSAGSGVVNNQNGEVASRVPSTTTSQSSQQQPIAYAESPVPGSPVTFSPQLPSEPFSFARDDSVSTTHHLQSKAVATVFSWGAGGNSVELEGSFDNWSSRHVMHKAGKDHSLVKLLSPGVYQYKFIVDGQWYAVALSGSRTRPALVPHSSHTRPPHPPPSISQAARPEPAVRLRRSREHKQRA